MAENIVERVMEIEAAADRIVADSRRRARELEESTKAEARALREEREKAFAEEMASFRAEIEGRTAAECGALDGSAQELCRGLEAVAPDRVARAIDLILAHLRGATRGDR
jgi:vacuolar-type H+-ATPase subunit H